MKEVELYQQIKDEFDRQCAILPYSLHLTRIESPSSAGVPDFNGCIGGSEFWIECKVNNNQLRPLQISWQTHRAYCGGLIYNIEYIYPRYNLFVVNGALSITSSTLSTLIEFIIDVCKGRMR